MRRRLPLILAFLAIVATACGSSSETSAGTATSVLVNDASGHYTIVAGPTWERLSEASAEGLGAWRAGRDSKGVMPGVSVTTKPAPEDGLDEYLSGQFLASSGITKTSESTV